MAAPGKKSTGQSDDSLEDLPSDTGKESSPAPRESLEDLRTRMETEKLSKEQREELLVKSFDTLITAEAKAALNTVAEDTEVKPESRDILKKGTAYLLALAKYTGEELGSLQDVITKFRTHENESIRFFSQTLIRVIAKPDSPMSQELQLHIWDEANEDAEELVSAMHAIEEAYKKKEAEAEEAKEKTEGKKDQTWYESHQSEINTALILGAVAGGIYWLTHSFFKKENGESSVSTGAKVATTALIAAEALGQILGFESVQKLISGGDPKSWVYGAGVRGWVSAADLELGTAMDFWTGNGPTEAEQKMFLDMGAIMGVSDSRLWGTSKLGFSDFMGGKNASILPWCQTDEEKIRTKIKDYYLPELEDKLPYLKDPAQRSTVSLRKVLIDGFKLGIIQELDTSDLSPQDREAQAERSKESKQDFEETRGYFDHPKEHADDLMDTSETMIAQLDSLDQATDQYWGDMLIAFEDMIGVDFDLGEDDSGEYRDLKDARELLAATFDKAGKVDHEFFRGKKERVKAFVVFMKKHEGEDPWSEATQSEYDAYKTEMLELNQKIRSSMDRAEMSNLKDMAKERSAGEIAEDVSEFMVIGLSGAVHGINYRLQKLSDGNKFYWALSIGQAIGVATEFVDFEKFEMKEVKGFSHAVWKVGKGSTWNVTVKPALKTFKCLYNGCQIFKAYRYSGEELLEKALKGELTKSQVETRARLAESFKDYYKSKWIRVLEDNVSAADLRLKKIAEVRGKLIYLNEMCDYADGKIKLSEIADDGTKALLKNELPAEKLQEIRFYRAVKSMRKSPQFNELVEHLKDPTKPLSAEGQALFDKLNPEQKATVTEMVKTKKGVEILGQAKIEPIDVFEPKWTKTEELGGEKIHSYKFGAEEYGIKEADIAMRAAELADVERAAGRGALAGEELAWNAANWDRAIKSLCEEKFSTPKLVRGNVYKFAGQELTIDAAELARRVETGTSEELAVRAMCVEKVTAHLDIEDILIKDGKYEYKINGKSVPMEDPTIAAKPDAVKAKFQETLAKEGKSIDFAKFAAEARTLKYFTMFEKVMGTVGAVMVIYHLETALDKRKAVCEIMAGFASFYAGMKLADWQVGSKIKSPGWRLAVDLGGGLATAFGFTEPISSLMEHYFKEIPASYGVGKEMSQIIVKGSKWSLAHQVLRSAEKGVVKDVVKYAAERTGIHVFAEVFEKKVGGIFLRKIGQLAAKQGFKQVLKALGWKGVSTAALLADDATVIGVVDDIVAAGFIVWMGFDIYDIVMLISNAVEVQDQMAERQTHPINSFDIKDAKSRAALQEKLIPYGLTIDRAYELPENTLFDILRTLPAVRVEFKRENTLGSEVWTLNNGEAVGIAIYGEDGKVACEITDEDAAVMDAALTEMEEGGAVQAAA